LFLLIPLALSFYHRGPVFAEGFAGQGSAEIFSVSRSSVTREELV
jgi:hypothetical protein